MKSSGYWYIRLLTGFDIRPLFVGLVTCAALLLIFITWVAIVDWQNRDFHFSVQRLLIELTLIVPASYSIGVTIHILKLTPLVGHSIIFLIAVPAVVMLPATGIRRRYVEEKNRQLEKVRARIAE